ncbi:hypothetical protein ACFLRB_04160 [Acidobacteriota bacterium]
MSRKRIFLLVVFVFFLTVCVVTPIAGSEEVKKQEAGDEKKEEKKEEKQDVKTEVTVDVEKINLDEKSKEKLKYFEQIQSLVKEINNRQGDKCWGNIFRRRAARLLKKAAGLSTETLQKEYLEALSADIKSNDFSASAAKWLEQTDHKLDIIIKPGPGKKTKKLDTFILLKHEEYSKVAEKYISVMDKMLGKVPLREDLVPFDASLISPILVLDVVSPLKMNQFMLVFPDNSVKTGTNKFKILIFRNILETYFNEFIKPLSLQIFTKKQAELVDFNSYLTNLLLRRLSHYFGPIFLEQESDRVVLIKDKLKDLFYYIEEIRVETTVIYSIQVLIDDKLLSEDQDKNIYATYLVSLFNRISAGPKSKTGIAATIQFNQHLKSGVVTFDLNSKKLKMDKKQMEKSTKRLVMSAIQVEKTGNFEEAERLIKGSLASPSDELKELYKNLKKNKKPRKVRKAKKKKSAQDKEKKQEEEKESND